MFFIGTFILITGNLVHYPVSPRAVLYINTSFKLILAWFPCIAKTWVGPCIELLHAWAPSTLFLSYLPAFACAFLHVHLLYATVLKKI